MPLMSDGKPRKRTPPEREPSLTIDYSYSVERWQQLCAGTSPVRTSPYVQIKCRRCDHEYKFETPPPELNKGGNRTRSMIGKYQSYMRSHSWNKHQVLDARSNTGIVILGEE